MDSTAPSNPKAMLWAGRVISGLAIAMLIFSAVMKLARPTPVVEEFTRLGYTTENIAVAIGILELACVIIYAIPQTAVFGAILLAAYLGGATATHVRISDPFFGPVIGGVLVWLGLWLREPRLRALVPWRKL
jgi:hypothetical protein